MKPAPKHQEIYSALVAEIANGAYPNGRLPSEAQLVRRFGVSRPTAGRALRDLQMEGIVERRAGSGTFVSRGPRAIPKSAKQFGLLLPVFGVSEIFEVLCGELASRARAHGYALLWGSSARGIPTANLTANDALELCDHFLERPVEGVFFAPFEFIQEKEAASRRTVDKLQNAGIPVVLIDRDLTSYPERSDLDLVGIDNVMAGYIVAEHLIKLGVKKLLFVARNHSAPTVHARAAGAREALINAGIEPLHRFLSLGDPEDISFVKSVVSRGVEGIICANDFTAAQILKSLTRMKVRVPEDVRIVGFDNRNYAELLAVPLTTVSQPCRDIAANAIRAMLDRIARSGASPDSVPCSTSAGCPKQLRSLSAQRIITLHPGAFAPAIVSGRIT